MPWLVFLPVLLWMMLYHMGRFFLPIFYHVADVIVIFIVEVGMALHYMF